MLSVFRGILSAMEMTTLGRTDFEVSRICIGCWQGAGWATSDDERFINTVRHAVDSGLNFLDTAIGYGNGHSEELVGKAIEGVRDKVIVATKIRPNTSRPEDVRKELEGCLKRLETDYIDLFQQHWPPKDIPLTDTIGEMERLKKEGKIRAIGVSNWMEPEWDEIDDPPRVECLQPNYSLLWRSIEKNVLPLCIKNDIAVITYSTLCQGILAGKFKNLDNIPKDPRRSNKRLSPEEFPEVLGILKVLEDVAEKYGKTTAQTAIRWILDRKGVTCAIVGASRPEQVDKNLGALDWNLEKEDRKKLADASWSLSKDLKPYDTLWGWHPKL